MPDLFKTLSVVALIAAGAMATAQTTPDTETDTGADAATGQGDETAPAGPNDLNLGTEVGPEGAANDPNAIGATYVKEEYGDWDMRCVRSDEAEDPCQLYQLLKDSDGNAVAEISMFGLPSGQQAAAGATVITPLETLLTQQLTIAVDGGAAKRYPYTFCTVTGCFARIGFTAADIATFRAGAKATISLVPAAAPDQKVELALSLSGFTAGFEAVRKENSTQ